MTKTWRKSSYSNDSGTCVEVANNLGEVRDSKNTSGPRLEFKPGQFAEFVSSVKADKFR